MSFKFSFLLTLQYYCQRPYWENSRSIAQFIFESCNIRTYHLGLFLQNQLFLSYIASEASSQRFSNYRLSSNPTIKTQRTDKTPFFDSLVLLKRVFADLNGSGPLSGLYELLLSSKGVVCHGCRKGQELHVPGLVFIGMLF